MNRRSSKTGGLERRGLGYDPEEAVRQLASVDPTLAKLMEVAGPFRLEVRRMHNPFEALARNIIYQQLHGRAAEAIHRRVLALFDKKRLEPEDVLAASEESLRGAGLSAAKLVALRDLAAKTLDGTVPTLARLRRMGDEEIVEQLTQVRGIGRWTVEMLLIFRLGRPDVLPVDDYAVRKGFALAYGMKESPKPKELARYGERWRPFRTVASWYMWRVHELPPGVLPPKKRRKQS
ncbi:MAG: DNA-3-methyladenine glycosylase 2 family protein [Acidobacteria bacterium]|nr:MAG: DNA-3-methyladenine glycosylase 2 family protein [Acidobacteriota bacterium]